jgi:hypothetical protein
MEAEPPQPTGGIGQSVGSARPMRVAGMADELTVLPAMVVLVVATATLSFTSLYVVPERTVSVQ